MKSANVRIYPEMFRTGAFVTRSRRPTSRFRPDFRRTRTTTQSPATTTLSERTITTRRRQSTQLPAAQKFERDTTTSKPSRSQSRFRVVTRKHFLRKPTTTEPVNDQERESSNKESNEEQDASKLSKIAIALQNIQQAPIRSTLSPTSKKVSTLEAGRSSKSYEYVSRGRNDLNGVTKVPLVSRTKTPTTPHTTTSATVKHSIPRTRVVNTFDKILPITSYTYKPITEYEYYDDDNTRVVGSIPVHSKVLIHSSGVIQCLDQGNFPHPVSCRKFISCAKMENGNVLGWEYTCAKNLSFDPIGGMCNWSAGLGCNE